MNNFKRIFYSVALCVFITNTSFAETISTNKSIIFKNKSDISSYKDLENNIENIFNKVQELRHLKAKDTVKVGIKDTKELNNYLVKMFKDEYKDKDIRNDYLTLYHFGLIKKDTDIKKTF